MPIPFIDLASQYCKLKTNIDASIQNVLDHGQYIMGPEIQKLEQQLAKYSGVQHAITVSDGTIALQIAMMALGIGHNDEVITSPFTFISTGEMISLIGAKPVFVDIDPDTYNINPALIEKAITERTKAIMPVSLYGQCADFDAINTIAKKYNLPVIEDGAQSFGATYHEKKSCSLSTIGCTSFFPSKPLGCYGDGGACFTDDADLAKIMREIRIHGQDKRYHHSRLGINGRFDTIQAAILLAKMPSFPDEVRSRENIGARYTELLKNFVKTPKIAENCTSVYGQYTIEVENRNNIQVALTSAGIPSAVHYPIPLHLQPAFAYLGLSIGSFPCAEKAANSVISLPMHPFLDEETQENIAQTIVNIITEKTPQK